MHLLSRGIAVLLTYYLLKHLIITYAPLIAIGLMVWIAVKA
jgi:hypothetical protein